MEDKVIKVKGLKKSMVNTMVKSWEGVPQFKLESIVDCEPMMAYRKTLDYKTSFTEMIVKAAAQTMKDNMALNSFWNDGEILEKGDINIGVAVASGRGLLVPVIQNAGEKSLKEITDDMKWIKEKSAKGNYSIEDLSCGTFTVSSLGKFRVQSFTSIVTYPQSAILSVPTMKDTLYLDEDGNVKSKKTMNLVLALDHRVVDGAAGAKFITELADLLENPENFE